jgi:hypothetical protein
MSVNRLCCRSRTVRQIPIRDLRKIIQTLYKSPSLSLRILPLLAGITAHSVLWAHFPVCHDSFSPLQTRDGYPRHVVLMTASHGQQYGGWTSLYASPRCLSSPTLSIEIVVSILGVLI